MLWDQGIWEPLDENPQLAYQKGHLCFILDGKKLKGRWDLIRFKNEKHWFLLKYADLYAKKNDDITTIENKSVLTQQTIEEITDPANTVLDKKKKS